MLNLFINAVNIFDGVKFVDVIEVIGAVTFAISGVRLASAKRIDWFGAFVVGFVTATGGGTLRDLLLDQTVFWLKSTLYFWCTALAMLVVIAFRRYLVHLNNTFFWFDTFGLSLFVVVGLEKTIALEYPYWLAIVMGTMTGVVGSVIRDILINEIPLVFSAELYAVACVLGGVVYCTLHYLGLDAVTCGLATSVVVGFVRILATKYNIHLPSLKDEDSEPPKDIVM